VPGTSLAMMKLALEVVRPFTTAPSEITVKLTLGALFTVTGDTPEFSTTVKAPVGLIAVSLAGIAAAAAMLVLAGGVGPGPAVSPPPPLSLLLHPARAATSKLAATKLIHLYDDRLLFITTPCSLCLRTYRNADRQDEIRLFEKNR